MEWDETGFSLVIRRKNGEKKGKRKKITGNGGGDELTSWEVCVSMIVSACVLKKGDGDIFYELQQLNDFVKKEWVEINRKTLKKGPKIVIILDNASYHKRLDVQDKIYKIT